MASSFESCALRTAVVNAFGIVMRVCHAKYEINLKFNLSPSASIYSVKCTNFTCYSAHSYVRSPSTLLRPSYVVRGVSALGRGHVWAGGARSDS